MIKRHRTAIVARLIGLAGRGIGIVGERRFGAHVACYRLPTPWSGRTAPIWGRIVRPRAIATVRTTFVRNAVTPMPKAPLVTPVVAVPAAAAAVTHQLYGRRNGELARKCLGWSRSGLH